MVQVQFRLHVTFSYLANDFRLPLYFRINGCALFLEGSSDPREVLGFRLLSISDAGQQLLGCNLPACYPFW